MKRIVLIISFALSLCASAEDGSNYWYSITFGGSTHELKVYENNGSKEYWREYGSSSGQYGDILWRNLVNNKWTFYYYGYGLQMNEQVTDSGFPTNLHFYGRNSRTGYVWKDFYLERHDYAPPPPTPYDIDYTNEFWSVTNGTFSGHYLFSGFDQGSPVWRGSGANGYGMQYGIRWNANTSNWNLLVGNSVNQSSSGTKYDQSVAFGSTTFSRNTNGIWNATSPVEVKGWKRHYIYGKADGTIHDPSGKVAPWVQAASISATTRELSQIADAARVTASNNLARMYAVTNQVTTFTKKIFVQAQLYPDLTKLTNCWGRVVKEWTDGTNDHCWVYFSRELKTAPVMKREYKAQTFTNVVEGVWAVPSFTNQSVMVDGYAGCKELIYRRPDNFVMKNCFTQPYLKWGTQEAGFNFGQRVFTIDDVLPFTGSWTNSLGKIWKFNNGTLVGEPTDVQ